MPWCISIDDVWEPVLAPDFVVGIEVVDESVHADAVDFMLGSGNQAHAIAVSLGMFSEMHPKDSVYQYGSDKRSTYGLKKSQLCACKTFVAFIPSGSSNSSRFVKCANYKKRGTPRHCHLALLPEEVVRIYANA